MLPIYLFGIAIVVWIIHMFLQRDQSKLRLLLQWVIVFNLGVMGLLAAYAHVFMPDQTAELIGWQRGSPFQFEVAMANLGLGLLGIASLWYRGSFWLATVLFANVYLIGCFVGHMIQYGKGNVAPYNFGPLVWFGDLFIPLFLLALVLYSYSKCPHNSHE